jgi:quercetin dioxygenase-like cupin family protein
MRRIPFALLLLTVVAPAALAQPAATHAAPPAPKWGPAPPVFPAGAQMEVMQGNPGANGLFTVRLRFPNGYRIAPHTHPTDENLTVISGTFQVGMGKTVDAKHMMTLRAGGFATAPAGEPHYAQARGTTVVQVHAMGPFVLTYVNPADMPKATAAR